MKTTALLLPSLALLLGASTCLCQAPAASPPPPPVVVADFKAEPANAPGGGAWLRLLAPFRSSPSWADGIVFYYDVLVQKGDQYRVLSGTARYSNVKAGSHSAVLYMSPSAVARFGAPVAAQVGVGYKDELIESFKWNAPGSKAPEGWSTQYERYSDQLMPIYLTPFVATEYGKYPDIMVSR
jgi:hypothetical protein